MAPLTPKIKVLLYLYSTRNIVGGVLALVGLGLFFGGIIADYWLPIVCALYASGVLLVPSDNTDLEFKVRNEMNQANLTESIEELISKSRKKLPSEAVERLTKIRDMVVELAPKLFTNNVAMGYAISLVNAVNRDLPETVKNYTGLPTAFATMHSIDNGKTCKQLLLEQLDLLYEQLGKIAENIYKDDADALVVNGKFLKDKFHPVSFVG
jgi:hypothetical protein